MGLYFFTIPVGSVAKAQSELNKFIGRHQVVSVEKEFVADGSNSFWSLCVTTTSSQTVSLKSSTGNKRNLVDYKQVLSPEDFKVFAELRKLRKQISETEGIPAYAVFTNEQLAGMVEKRVHSVAELSAIEGIGQGRITKYAQKFLDCLKDNEL